MRGTAESIKSDGCEVHHLEAGIPFYLDANIA